MPAVQSQPKSQSRRSRKYPECTSWFIPFPQQVFSRQSIEVEPSKKDGESDSDPVLHPEDAESGSKPCLGHRLLLSLNPLSYAPEYVWMSYEDVDRRRRELGSALVWFFKRLESDGTKMGRDDIVIVGDVKDELGLEIDTVCIWANGSAEWQLVDLACQAYNKVVTALYDSSNNSTVEYVLNHAESNIIFLSIDRLPVILQLFPKLKYLQGIVLLHSDKDLELFEAYGSTMKLAKSWAKNLGIDIWSFEEFGGIGKQHISEPIDVSLDAVYSLCYTSGTTGYPQKAAILTHGQAALAASCGGIGMVDTTTNIVFSALPMAHAYQRVLNTMAFNQGGAIGFAQPNPLLFLEDLKLLKPTVLSVVPRLLNRIYQGVMASFVDGTVKAALFHYAVKSKMDAHRSTGTVDHLIWDRVIFNKIKPLLGGNVSTIQCGSSAISADVLDFIKIAFNCQFLILRIVYLGTLDRDWTYTRYGLTETFAVGLRVLPQDPTGSFSVGTMFPCMEARVVDAEELGYFVRPQHAKGEHDPSERPCDPKGSKYTFGPDGWIYTGDIVEMDECGRFKIIDRKKNIVKLSIGESVALEQVESLYAASPIVAQLFVYGDATRDYLVAIITPVEGFGKELDSKPSTSKDGDSTQMDLKTAILLALEEQAKFVGLKGYEKIRNIHITNELFTVEGGMLTPTLKVRRKNAYKKYKDIIEELYKMPIPSLPSGTSGRL
ncbi:hypothetical protein Clacol_003405 [Clathrus columnatus]|uniref:AMP-dependent synthetase/ligase domain-containing protein n=1 Tax=Clathrus columnatus TaxID=1419009 RepID=A0AAV5A6T2_9AGAM|nr:hypothetical protein Clacol_003405 [Clathrus columnatus]